MPICPECKEEFRQDIKTCPECQVALVESLENVELQAGDLEVVCTIIQEENAYILRGFLENEGIPCQLENVSFHAGPAPAGELTKVRLWVKKEDVNQARQRIEEHEKFTTCSSCGHVVLSQDTVCDFCGESLESD
ncbi:MAG: putative signal transducing protein [Nitrospinaceae bacterium]